MQYDAPIYSYKMCKTNTRDLQLLVVAVVEAISTLLSATMILSYALTYSTITVSFAHCLPNYVLLLGVQRQRGSFKALFRLAAPMLS
jgi:hypothetical protein